MPQRREKLRSIPYWHGEQRDRCCSSRDCTRSRQKGRGRGWKVVVLSVGGWLRRLVLLAIQPLLGIEVTGSLLRNTNSRNKLAASRHDDARAQDWILLGLFFSRRLFGQLEFRRTGVKFYSSRSFLFPPVSSTVISEYRNTFNVYLQLLLCFL